LDGSIGGFFFVVAAVALFVGFGRAEFGMFSLCFDFSRGYVRFFSLELRVAIRHETRESSTNHDLSNKKKGASNQNRRTRILK
jgi:hypothetical protein